MALPFTEEEFLQNFKDYNADVWPVIILAYVVALVMLFLLIKRKIYSDNFICAGLGFFWIWIGVVYQIAYFSKINTPAYFFGLLFIIQGILFLFAGPIRNDIAFRLNKNKISLIGGVIVLYSMVIYNLVGMTFGHTYPEAPMFGIAPCPTTIFTYGILLFTKKPVPKYILPIPVLWGMIGSNAAFNWGIWEDIGLIVSMIITISLLYRRDKELWKCKSKPEKTTDF